MDAQLLAPTSTALTSLRQLQGAHKTLVVEFWKPDCERCPAALDKLNTLAASLAIASAPVVVVSCALVPIGMADDILELTR